MRFLSLARVESRFAASSVLLGTVPGDLVPGDRLAASGVRFDRLVATGGGAKSRLWVQLKADVLGLTIDTLETEDAGTVGCAMMAGVAAGAFRDLAAAKALLVRKTDSFVPDARRHAAYDQVYRRYAKLYDAVRPLV